MIARAHLKLYIYFIMTLCFKNTKDITCDELGSWTNNGCHDTWVIVDAHGIAETCGKAKPVAASDGSVPYRVCKKYWYVNRQRLNLTHVSHLNGEFGLVLWCVFSLHIQTHGSMFTSGSLHAFIHNVMLS